MTALLKRRGAAFLCFLGESYFPQGEAGKLWTLDSVLHDIMEKRREAYSVP